MRSFSGSKAWFVVAVLIVGSLTACDSGSTDVESTSPPTETTTISPSPLPETAEAAPIDDPATEAVEVAGENLAWFTKDYTTSDTSGKIDRYLNGTWKSKYTMSDPRLTGRSTVVFNSDQNDHLQFYRWWIYPTIENDGGTWEGLDTGEIRPDDDHEGWGVYLGTGGYEGLEFHERVFMGPGAVTTNGDAFEVTGVIHDVAVEGWMLDRTFPAARSREAVRTTDLAWNTGDGDAALALYAPDAVFVNSDGSTATGKHDIAELVASAADVGFEIELLPPLFVRGNYAAGAFHWANDTDEGWVLAVFRFDDAGRIAHHEVIAASA
jgi:hypothetical protein